MAFDFNSTTNKNYLQTINPNTPDAGSALKVLSLNLPNFLGGSPIAPDGLLRPGLSTSAQVGGTAPLSAPTPAPGGAAPGAGPDQSGGAPSPQSPFPTTTAPIADLVSSIIGSTPSANSPTPGAPNITVGDPIGPPIESPNVGGLADVLQSLFRGGGGGGRNTRQV